MFRGGAVNPYDDIVAKATDENQTSENWEILLNLCDKVSEEGEQGARNVVAALLKRLTHRNANVQLYALSVAEALSKNCDITVHREMASKVFTQGLEKLATDRTGHEKVKKRTLALIKLWSGEFAYDAQLGLMEECFTSLKAKGLQFEGLEETPAPTYDDEARRREEEELQRVLEMSLHDKGGRDRWAEYTSYGSGGASGSSAAAGPGAGAGAGGGSAYTPAARPAVASTSRQDTIPAPVVAAAAPAPASAPVPAPVQPAPEPTPAPAPAAAPSYASPAPTAQSPTAHSAPLDPSTLQIVKRVKALHDFAATEAGELSFKKGDIIKVVDRCYKDWWRGQIKGRVGLLPVNYVEALPEPTAAELAKEAEDESLVWAQGGAIDSLLQKLRDLDPANENLNDNEEIQELYRSSMSLRPKILRLIDKYSQKKAELVVMNERYVKARNTFERMMEESVAKHNPSAAIYEYGQPQGPPEPYGRGDNRAASGAYGWNQSVYGQVPPEAAAAYAGYQAGQPPQPQQHPPVQHVPQEYPPQPYGQATYPQEQYPQQQQQPQQQPQQPQQQQQQYGYGYPQPGQDQAQQAPGYQQQQQYGPHPQGQQPPQQQQGYQPQPQPQPQQQQGAQPPLQQAYSYGAEQHTPAPQQQQQGAPPQTPAPQQQVPPEQQHAYGQQPPEQHAYGQPPAEQPHAYGQQPTEQPHAYGQSPAEQQHPYGQPPVEQQPQPQQVFSPQPDAQAQAQPGYQPQPYQTQQQGYQPVDQSAQPQPQPQPEQAQSPQAGHNQLQQAQAQAQHQPEPQAQPQAAAAAAAAAAPVDSGPPYVWNGTNNYPNQGACQWAEYYIGGGDDLSGLVYFTSPDGQPLKAVPPRGAAPDVQALQQGFANVRLEGQVQGA